MPDMCDMVRPTWLDDCDVAAEAPLLADNAATVPDDDDDDVVIPDPANVKPSLPPSLDFRGPEARRAFSVSESSTRSDGKSNSCCLSVSY